MCLLPVTLMVETGSLVNVLVPDGDRTHEGEIKRYLYTHIVYRNKGRKKTGEKYYRTFSVL